MSERSDPVLRIRILIRDPVPSDPWIRNPGWVKINIRIRGSGSGMNSLDHISGIRESFWPWIMEKFESGIRDKHPGSTTPHIRAVERLLKLVWSFIINEEFDHFKFINYYDRKAWSCLGWSTWWFGCSWACGWWCSVTRSTCRTWTPTAPSGSSPSSGRWSSTTASTGQLIWILVVN